MNRSKPLRTAIIGVTSYGVQHYEMLMGQVEQGEMVPVAATIINPAEAVEPCARLRALGCEIFSDYETMLRRHAGGLDLCMIPTGIPWHAPMTVAALESGANVFVEKPVAGCLADAERMREAARRCKRRVWVGFQRMYSPVTWMLRERLADGVIGEVQSLTAHGTLKRGSVYFGRNNWAGKLKVGDRWVLDSPFNNAMAHFLMMIRFFAGPTDSDPEPFSVEAGLYRAEQIESCDTATVRIRMGGKALYFIATHCCRDHREAGALLRGTEGTVSWEPYSKGGDQFSERVVIRRKGRPDEVHETNFWRPLRDEMIRRVCASLRGESVEVCDLDTGIAHTRCVQAIHDRGTIKPVPSDWIEHDTWRGAPAIRIRGIDELLGRCAKEEKLLSEIGVPWA
jgi:predicted dehydrogenase